MPASKRLEREVLTLLDGMEPGHQFTVAGIMPFIRNKQSATPRRVSFIVRSYPRAVRVGYVDDVGHLWQIAEATE